MKYYNNLDFQDRTHTIRITLQSGKFKGHIAYEMGGNCLGASLLTSPFDYFNQDDIDLCTENDCGLAYDEEAECYTFTLNDDDGNKCFSERDQQEIENCVVCAEIVNCKVNERKCRICGCTQRNACMGGCYWVEDDLCSKCAKEAAGCAQHAYYGD